MKIIGNIISMFGLYIIYIGTFGQRSNFSFNTGVMLISLVVGFGVLIIGGLLTGAALSHNQKELNKNAEEVFNPKNSFPQKKFALYLRSFSVDGVFKLSTSHRNLFSWENYDRPGVDALERILADALEKTCPLIGLSQDSNDKLGLGKGGTFVDWQKRIGAAIGTARLILVVPSANEGTLWEIGEILRQKELINTIFVMPPTNLLLEFDGKESYPDIWARARSKISEKYHFDIPQYEINGMFFNVKQDRQLWLKIPIENADPNNLAKKLRKLISSSRIK